jgi:hypothetical protein
VEAVPDRPMAADGPGARLRCHRPGRDTDAYGAGLPGFFPRSLIAPLSIRTFTQTRPARATLAVNPSARL